MWKILIIALSPFFVLAKDSVVVYNGIVTEVVNGDTFYVNSPQLGNTRLKLLCVDAPKLSQNAGPLCRTILEEAILNKKVFFVVDTKIGLTYISEVVTDSEDGESVGGRLVKYGWAFTTPDNKHDCTILLKYEGFARHNRLGIFLGGSDSQNHPLKYRQVKNLQLSSDKKGIK